MRMKSGVVRGEECDVGLDEQSAVLCHILELTMHSYIDAYRTSRNRGIGLFVLSIAMFVSISLIPFLATFMVYMIAVPVLSALGGVFYIWRMLSLRPRWKIKSLGCIDYPVAFYKEDDGRFVIFDAGGSVQQQEFSFPTVRDTDRFGDSVVRVRSHIREYDELMTLGAQEQLEKLSARDDYDRVLEEQRIETLLEDPMSDLASAIGDDNLERLSMKAPVIESDSMIADEICSIAEFAVPDDRFETLTDIASIRAAGVCLEVDPVMLAEQARVFRRWSADALEQDIMLLAEELVSELDEEFSEIAAILSSVPATIEATMPYSLMKHENQLNYHFCPHCRLDDLKIAEHDIDLRAWVNEKILGNALDDADLMHPHEHGDREAVLRARERIEETICESLPLAEPHFGVMLAGLRELEMGTMGEYRCPSCSYAGEGITLPRSFHPLSSAYLSVLTSNARHMQEKSDVIIRNVHDVIMNKESKLVGLGPYEQTMQQAEQNKLEVEGDLDTAEAISSVIEEIRSRG